MKYQLLIIAGVGYSLLFMGETSEKEVKQQKTMESLNQNIGLEEGQVINKANHIERDFPENYGEIFQEKARTVLIEIVPELMKYDTDTFTVKAGEKIILELDNLDGMQHNLLIIKPGTLEKVGAAADAMLREPRASEKHYVPDMPEVLVATEMVGPGELFSLNFTVPDTPGDYPFVCTFPGHWRMMNGIMRVEKNR